MKKIIVFGLVLCLLLLNVLNVSAGGRRDARPGEGQRFVIANVPKLVGGAWFNRMRDGAYRFASDTGHDVFQQGAITGDPALQIRELENLIEQRVDIINVVPNSPESLEVVLARAMAAGITVISHEAEGIQNVHWNVEPFNNYDYGAHLMNQLARLMGEEGEYLLTVGSLAAGSHVQWATGALNRQREAFPNMRIVSEVFFESGMNQRVAQDRAAEFMRAFPNLRGMITMAATDLPGFALAVEEAGQIGRVFLVGNGVPNVNRAHLESGALAHLSCWDPGDVGYVMAKVGVMVRSGERITAGMDLGVPGYNNIRVVGNNIFGAAWRNIFLDSPAHYWF